MADGELVLAAVVLVATTVVVSYWLYRARTPAALHEQTAPSPAPAPPERKSTRSKERRRRGKDPLRNLFKKSKAVKSDHPDPPAVQPGNDIPSSTSCSQSLNTTPNNTSDAYSHTDPDSVTTVVQHAQEDAPPLPTDFCTPQPRDSQPGSTSGSCAKLVRARTRLRITKIEGGFRSPDSVAGPCSSLSIAPSTSDGVGPSTPTNLTPPVEQPHDDAASALASMHDALEAARVREEQLRAEADQATKERDELRWRWNEDANVWRRRESELQAQIHHLVQQLQTYAAVASFQASTHPLPSPSSPHIPHDPLAPFPLPPAMQTQNSVSPPAHVQALLASAPMLPTHPFAVPYPGPAAVQGLGTSPLLWSGLCVPNRDPRHGGGRRTPDSSTSASESSSRRRRRRRRPENVKSASDESSLGDWDGSGDEVDVWEEEEEEEDIFRNNALADAILKRPESIRGWGGRSANGRGRPGERMDEPASDAPLVVDRR